MVFLQRLYMKRKAQNVNVINIIPNKDSCIKGLEIIFIYNYSTNIPEVCSAHCGMDLQFAKFKFNACHVFGLVVTHLRTLGC